MMLASWIMILGALGVAFLTLRPGLMGRATWRATATPLASIIGSGFLVAGPILGDAAGPMAVFAMLGLCAIAWLFGSAIRANIALAEPMLAKDPPHWLRMIERASDMALALAYFVSVAYYLNLFAAFALRIVGIVDPHFIRLLSTGVIAAVGLVGLLRGLHWLENIELPAVGLKLALIGGVVLALLYATGAAIADGGITLPRPHHPAGFHELRVLLGLVILVQGFETSRYLGGKYDRATRIATMRRAQIISTVIYAMFIGLVTPYFTGGLPPQGGETAIIDILRPLGWSVAPLIIGIALASQLSAAVADMNGGGGLIHGSSGKRLSDKWGYAITAMAAIGITWAADIYQIIVHASKAFVLYYGLQCASATLLCLGGERRQIARAGFYALGMVIAIAVLALGLPAEGAG